MHDVSVIYVTIKTISNNAIVMCDTSLQERDRFNDASCKIMKIIQSGRLQQSALVT